MLFFLHPAPSQAHRGMVFQHIFRHGPFNRPIQVSATMLSSYRKRCRHLSDVNSGTDHSKMAIPSENKIWAQLRPAVAIQDTPSTVLVLHPPIKTSIIARLLKDYRTFVFASTGSEYIASDCQSYESLPPKVSRNRAFLACTL
jgi:hypothetical protein